MNKQYKLQPIPIFLPEKSHDRGASRLQAIGLQESDKTWRLNYHHISNVYM